MNFHTKNTNEEIAQFKRKIHGWTLAPGITLFSHRDKILAVKNSHLAIKALECMYCMRFGEHIGWYENGKFTPTARAFRWMLPDEYTTLKIPDEETLDFYFRGGNLKHDISDGYILFQFSGVPIALEYVHHGMISNSFPKDWRRK